MRLNCLLTRPGRRSDWAIIFSWCRLARAERSCGPAPFLRAFRLDDLALRLDACFAPFWSGFMELAASPAAGASGLFNAGGFSSPDAGPPRANTTPSASNFVIFFIVIRFLLNKKSASPAPRKARAIRTDPGIFDKFTDPRAGAMCRRRNRGSLPHLQVTGRPQLLPRELGPKIPGVLAWMPYSRSTLRALRLARPQPN